MKFFEIMVTILRSQMALIVKYLTGISYHRGYEILRNSILPNAEFSEEGFLLVSYANKIDRNQDE